MLKLIYLVTTYFRKSKNALSKGIIIAVKEEISSKCSETTETENNRILSLRIDTQNIVTTIISVYRPQENEKTKFYNGVICDC